MNLGYGIKMYQLKEEAAIPSLGYNDAVTHMGKRWNNPGKRLKIKSRDEIRQIILSKESVKQAMAAKVKVKLDYYRGTMHLNIDEDAVYREVENEAIQDINTLAANYSHKALQLMAKIMRYIFITIYDKIIVNEDMLKKVRTICDSRKGPVIFVPTHRSYVDFLLVSAILFYYKMEIPHICAGEDLMHITGVSHFLRMSGAFFMRRTFRGDPLYKALFTEYVT